MELIVSVALITGIVLIADITLAIQGNWPKILRVTLAAAAYVGLLGMILKAMGRFPAPPSRLPLWVFLVAGAGAGFISGIVRPELNGVVVIASSALTPALLGTVHWIALQRWAWFRQRIASRPRASGKTR